MGNHGARVLTWLVPKLFPKSLDSKWISAKLSQLHVEQFCSGIVQPSLALGMLTSPEIFLPLRKWDFMFLTAIIYWWFILELTQFLAFVLLPHYCCWVQYRTLSSPGSHPELCTGFLRLFLSSPHTSSSRTPYFIWSPLLLNTDSWKKTHGQHFCLKQSCYFCFLQQHIFNMCFLRASCAAPETCLLRICAGLE